MPPGLRVLRAAPQLLVQDLGRPGWAHIGVPPSGALDPGALALANRLVGNSEAAAGLEILLGGCRLLAGRSLRVALTGAQLPLSVGAVPRPWGTAVSVRPGQYIEVGTSATGLRSWLAVGGGLDVPRTLGSRSTDTLTGLGPAPVREGDLLPVGGVRSGPGHGEAVPAVHATGATRLSVRLGPRDDAFTDESVDALLKAPYAVSARSDRVGVRLEALDGSRLLRRGGEEMESEGLVTGAVQVPSGGQPLVFLADHPVTGGYPVVAVVDDADLGRCAQLRPGDQVRFVRATQG
ncbi:MAG: hypothetical protein QOK30_604 [Nocardioidaceae bacterium]|nr:hypothetical protein [Nocardioidaceae bacterium]